MKHMKTLIISVLGIAVILTGYGLHNHITKVKAAKLEHIAAPAPYFPAGLHLDPGHQPCSSRPSVLQIISWLAGAGGWGMDRMQIDWNMRVVQADASTPFVPFQKTPTLWPLIPTWFQPFLFPPMAASEGQTGYQCDTSQQDCHLIVVDRGHGKLYEAYQANYADNALIANFLAVWDLNRVYPPSRRGDQCTSADAAGLPIAPLLFNADELAAGSINHAIRFILPNPRIRAHVFVHPATHAGAPRGPITAPPMGARFRLKASYDLSQLTPAAQVVARAMQKYGMFLSDGGNITLTAQNDADTKAKYADMDFSPHDLQDLKVTDFEVVRWERRSA